MYAEEAWDLRPGDEVDCTTTKGETHTGSVLRITPFGITKQEYIDGGMNEIQATEYQYDGPSIVVQIGSEKLIWRPDCVKLVTRDFHVHCSVCDKVVALKVPKKFNVFRLPEVQRKMITMSRCGEHV